MRCKRQILWTAALLAVLAAGPGGCRDADRKAKEAAVVELQGPGPGRRAGGAHSDAVRRVLEADEALSEQYIQVRYADPITWREGHLEYAREMNAISAEGAPRGFTEGFREHQEAWEAYAAFLVTIPVAQLDALMDRGAARRPENAAVVNRARALNQDISSTWAAVEMQAGTVGVGEGASLRAPPAPVGSSRKLLGSPR